MLKAGLIAFIGTAMLSYSAYAEDVTVDGKVCSTVGLGPTQETTWQLYQGPTEDMVGGEPVGPQQTVPALADGE